MSRDYFVVELYLCWAQVVNKNYIISVLTVLISVNVLILLLFDTSTRYIDVF